MTLRLLLAEDDSDLALVARLALRRSGFDVIVVSNGADAVSRAGEDRPDAVLLDWMMPGMDGPEVCERLKTDAATRNIPVIFLTAKSDPAEIQHALSLGALGLITKPFNVATLGQQVRDLLSRSE